MATKTFIILHNIRSAHNVGSLFRTAEGAGVAKIYLCGYTPAPVDRFGRSVVEIEKTSLGASRMVPWQLYEHTEDAVEVLKSEHVSIVAVEQHQAAVDFKTFIRTGDTAYIFGNEIEGVPETLCAQADMIVHIPMRGRKESLNVSVAAGVILFADGSTSMSGQS